ncbi:MAG TPA: endopeptidase La [Gemmatimonadaceae bacterium]|nr:endopeptidase La [Gemmatimonadaceae bacterium]
MIVTRDSESFDVPDRLPVVPLRDVVVFPYVVMPLLVGRSGSLAAIDASAGQSDRLLVLVAQRNAETSDPTSADLYRMGVVVRLQQIARTPSGTIRVLIEALGRVRITRFSQSQGHLRATITAAPFVTAPLSSDDRARARQALARFEEYVGLQRRIPAEVVALAQSSATEERMACAIAAHLAVRHEVRQRLLESPTLGALLHALAELMSAEIEIVRLERKIDEDVRGSLYRNQREFYLQEQLKAIHRELGQEDGDDFEELAAQIARKGLPEAARARAERELRKLRRMSPMSPEAAVGRNYIDWLVSLPWTERTDDVLDVEHARQVLEEDHHGLDEVKDRILDHIAVLALVGRLQGPILCLVGPPGTGKTSLGRSIARALGRRFVRMSLGGVRDEAEIRGHRRTYIGALPGRVIQGMRRAEVVNPVFLLDEIDKLGQDYRGDPSSALLEVLDPEQNRAFSDHYLEIDYDLSGVLFVTTANSLATIPDALRDRMEILRLPGYLDHEKYAIARRYLVPRQLERAGLPPDAVTLAPEVIPTIVRQFTREAGVRELDRRIARLARKIARRRAADGLGHAARDRTVAVTDLRELLGVAPYDPDENTLDDKVGVAAGLAYTTTGGEVLEIEVSVVPGRGRLHLTGTLGDVMKESASAALSYIRARARALGVDPEFSRKRDVHVHIPAGATPKDGPSAGIAIASAVISALTGVPVRGDTAMTGEITLRGRVLGIGGLREKSVAALRSRIRHVVIPKANERELEEIPDDVRGELHFHPVATMDEVLGVAFRKRPASAAGDAEGVSTPLASPPPPMAH